MVKVINKGFGKLGGVGQSGGSIITGANLVQIPYSQFEEAPSKREWHDTHRTWSSHAA